MRFDYFDMLSGEPIYLQGVGHLRSPRLCELKPKSGIGYRSYNLYLNLLSWDKEHLLKYDQLMQYRGADKLNRKALNVFDIATLLMQTRELCRGVLSFFMVEDLMWDEAGRRYLAINPENPQEIVGEINRDNFEEVRRLMLQFNFIGLDKDDAPASHTTDKSKELWEQSQKFLKEQADTEVKEDKPEYHLSNIISKICAIHSSYNLFNIYELTIFQLYDTFFQVGYVRSANLSEQIFSNHGGDYYVAIIVYIFAARIVCIYSDVYVFLIEMLEIPKAHVPKRSDEISAGVTAAKAEKSREMGQG